jgi:hypothetical protein
MDNYWQRAFARWQRVYDHKFQVLPQQLANLSAEHGE